MLFQILEDIICQDPGPMIPDIVDIFDILDIFR